MRRAACLLAIAVCVSLAQADGPITNGGFETLDAEGLPVDWQILGEGAVTDEAHSGEHAMLLRRDSAEGLCGLNRVWEPGSGEQGTMLSQLTGGVRFWYRADESSKPGGLVFYVIPMSDEPLEVGGGRAQYVVPGAHIGDGQWHEGAVAYDYADEDAVKWVHISPRLRGERAQLLLDDITWVDHVGPVPAVEEVELTEVAGREGERCVVGATLANSGDRPIEDATATLVLPQGLRTDDEPARTVDSLAGGDDLTLRWAVDGVRDREGRIAVAFEAAERVATGIAAYAPALQIDSFMVDRAILPPGETAQVTLTLRNDGHAITRGIVAELQTPGPLTPAGDDRRRRCELLRPGAKTTLRWQVRAGSQTPEARLQVAVSADNAPADEPGAADTVRERAAATVVIGPSPEAPTDLARPGAEVVDGTGVIGDATTRIVFPPAQFEDGRDSWGIGIVQRRVGEWWQTVATLPRLTRLVTQGGPARLVYADDIHALPADEAELPTLELTAEVTDADGARWRIAETVALAHDPTRFVLAVTATPDTPAQVRALDGPIMCVGDGAPPGTRRLDAIFPGLEWLVEGERSSSSLDISPEHPHRIRYVPHPHMVTIPIMCARLAVPDAPDAIVSCAWDHLRPYVRDLNRPSAMFASPDRFTGHSWTTMGLFAPSMPEYIEPNERVAHTPLQLDAGEQIELIAELSVMETAEGETALAAVTRWFDRHGVAEPNPLPHGRDLVDEVEFDMAAYLRSLWNEEQQKWHPIFFGPAEWRAPRWVPGFLYDMRMGIELAEDTGVRERVRERYDHVVQLSGLRPVAQDEGYHFAGPAERLLRESDTVTNLIASQRDDGSWRFHAHVATSGVFEGRDYGELGPDNAAEVGTCARNAWRLLRFARMTGDEAAREAGLHALDFMERFQVPRAAQVWEVPVHTPDVLASADACEACLEGYLLTGDARHLERAVYWARTGLPFVYQWDVEGFEFVRHASIPVFGATWFTGSWFGRPVQWNGLVHARALLQLAEHDDSLDWRRLARGITVSAMYQQYTDAEHQALWPDSISAIDGNDSGANFAPRRILHTTYRLMGLQPTPVTAVADTDDGAIPVTAAGRVGAPELRDGALRFTVTYEPPQIGYVTVCRVSRPDAVVVNGTPAAEVELPVEADPPCWRYLQQPAMVELRLDGSGTHEVELAGVDFRAARLSPEPAAELSFSFDAGVQGWSPAHDLATFAVTDGVLHTATTGPDPYMVRSQCRIPADDVTAVTVRMALEPGLGESAQIFWATAGDPGIDEAKSLRFEVIADGRMHEYTIPVGDHPAWAGTITALRLDPTGGEVQGAVRIDEIAGR